MSELGVTVDRILDRVASLQPLTSDLGTPDIDEPPEVRELADLGRAAIPILLERAEHAPAKIAAYAVKAIAMIGDPAAVEPLRRLGERYEAMADKAEWEYAVIGQVRLALSD